MNKTNRTSRVSSTDYIYRCIDIIRADKNVSDDTLVLMFMGYGKLLLEENQNKHHSNQINKK